MKNTFLTCLLLFLFGFYACQSRDNNKSNEVVAVNDIENKLEAIKVSNPSETNANDIDQSTAETVQPPPPPPPSKKRVENEKKESSKSIFLKSGCCETISKRRDDCCCMAVLEKYKTLSSNNDPNIGNYKMKDPILGNCRRAMPKAFELVDFPPKANGEADYEDLF